MFFSAPAANSNVMPSEKRASDFKRDLNLFSHRITAKTLLTA